MNEVILKKLQQQDADELFLLVDKNRSQLKKFVWQRETRSPADSEYYIRVANHKEESNGAATRGVFVAESLIGIVTLHIIDWTARSSALGYWIDADETGKGYATEAVRQLTDVAFSDLPLERLTACINTSNQPSIAVLGRLGFRLTGIDYQATWRHDGSDPVEVAHLEMTRSMYEGSLS